MIQTQNPSARRYHLSIRLQDALVPIMPPRTQQRRPFHPTILALLCRRTSRRRRRSEEEESQEGQGRGVRLWACRVQDLRRYDRQADRAVLYVRARCWQGRVDTSRQGGYGICGGRRCRGQTRHHRLPDIVFNVEYHRFCFSGESAYAVARFNSARAILALHVRSDHRRLAGLPVGMRETSAQPCMHNSSHSEESINSSLLLIIRARKTRSTLLCQLTGERPSPSASLLLSCPLGPGPAYTWLSRRLSRSLLILGW